MSTFEKFSDSARTLLRLAQEEAKRSGYREVEVEHLLIGLVEDGESRGVEILRELDIDVTMFYEKLKALLVPGTAECVNGLSIRSKVVVVRVAYLCNSELGPIAGPEHFLLALTYEEHSQGVTYH